MPSFHTGTLAYAFTSHARSAALLGILPKFHYHKLADVIGRFQEKSHQAPLTLEYFNNVLKIDLCQFRLLLLINSASVYRAYQRSLLT
jgi:hypothetical protein